MPVDDVIRPIDLENPIVRHRNMPLFEKALTATKALRAPDGNEILPIATASNLLFDLYCRNAA